jgi:hypothetical protein
MLELGQSYRHSKVLRREVGVFPAPGFQPTALQVSEKMISRNNARIKKILAPLDG